MGGNRKKETDVLGGPVRDPVQDAMGNFGPWHTLIVISLSFVNFPVAWQQLSIMFLAPKTSFNCVPPSSDNNNIDNNFSANFTGKCEILVANNRTEKCTEFEYDKSVFNSSIITEWDLICERQYLGNIVQTITMLGVLVGNMIFGMIADRIGRKIPLVIAVLLQCVTGLASAFSPWYELFLLLKFIAALATGGTMLTSFVILMEIVGVEWRPTCSVLFHVPFIIGHMMIPLISYVTRSWNGFQIAVSLPAILLLSYYWIIPESPRWLLAVGKADKAEEILLKAAKKNKIDVSKVKEAMDAHRNNQDFQINNLNKGEAASSDNDDKKNDNKKYNVTHLFRTRNLRIKTICICVNWLTCGICFFGLAHYVSKLGGNIFIVVAASAVIELPGTLLVYYLISRVSRLKILIFGNLVSGISLLLLITTANPLAHVCLASVGLFGMSVSFPTVYLYSTEVFPTVVRNVGLGLASLCSRGGSMIAPFIADLGEFQSWLPPLIFCIGPLIGAGLCIFLPETMNCELPDTIEEGENFGNLSRRFTGKDDVSKKLLLDHSTLSESNNYGAVS